MAFEIVSVALETPSKHMSDEVDVFCKEKKKVGFIFVVFLPPNSFLWRFPCGPYTAHLLQDQSA
jgi:hypothetical protein